MGKRPKLLKFRSFRLERHVRGAALGCRPAVGGRALIQVRDCDGSADPRGPPWGMHALADRGGKGRESWKKSHSYNLS